MKNLIKISIAMLLFAGITTSFFSCNDATESDLSLSVSQDKMIVRKGDTLKIAINAVTTNDKIATVVLMKNSNSLTLPAISDVENYNETYDYLVDDNDGELTFTVSVTGNNYVGTIEKSIYANVVSNVDITLGAKTSPLESFMNGTTLQKYNATNAATNQGDIDLVYTFSTTDGAIIGAPSDASFVLSSWTTKNATKVGRITEQSMSAVDAVTTSAVKNLVVGDLIGYVTITGTRGIIIVKNIVVGDNGNTSMTFSVIK